MRNLRALGLAELIRDRVEDGTPLLGICLGMQLLLDSSNELERTPGLGLIPGDVRRLETGGLRVPHIGWNEVAFELPSRLNAGLPAGGCPFYHVHSMAAHPHDPADIVGGTEYGERFATMVARGSVTESSSTPRSPPPMGCGCSRTSTASAWRRRIGRRRCGHDPAAGDRHSRRQGGAADAGRFQVQDRLRRGPARGRAPVGRGGARGLHVVDLDGARTGAPSNVAPRRADRRGSSTCRYRLEAGYGRSTRSGGRRGRGGRVIWDRGVPGRRLSRRRVERSASASWCRSTPAAAWPATAGMDRGHRRCRSGRARAAGRTAA